ncbi:glycosyl transferase [Macrococcus armenti]|uniref:glycosyl transferase n=1 Tax=Macrococcus armenti TaxID=2875764 RepID=UPI001CCA8258|nr:glycosyl transferase [Macrococcus armenti]UBH13863.1 glycosyl transferase [Macrococcus armenti]
MASIDVKDLNRSFLEEHNNQRVVIKSEGLNFYIKLALKETSDKLVVFSNGAIDPSKKKPPLFMRSNWVEDMTYSAVFIDDKTIHNSPLRIGWGVGNKNRHYLIDYSIIAKKISHVLRIKDENVYYFGSSAGGFMALGLATFHKDATAIVNNPQTDVMKYYEKSYKALFQRVFRNMEIDEVNKLYRKRLSLIEMFKTEAYVPKAFYFQNKMCRTDMVNHLNPMKAGFKDIGLSDESIRYVLYEDEIRGHNPPTKENTLKYIDMVVYEKGLEADDAFLFLNEYKPVEETNDLVDDVVVHHVNSEIVSSSGDNGFLSWVKGLLRK